MNYNNRYQHHGNHPNPQNIAQGGWYNNRNPQNFDPQYLNNNYVPAAYQTGYGGNYLQQQQQYHMYPKQHPQPRYNYHRNKRRHENLILTPSASTSNERASTATTRSQGETSPAAKRYLQKQASVESVPPQAQAQAAKPQQQNKKPNNSNVFQNQKEQEWIQLFQETIKIIEICKPGEEVNIMLRFLQPSRASWQNLKDVINKDMSKLMSPLGLKNVLVFGSTLTGLDFIGSDLDYYIQLIDQPATEEAIKETIQKVSKLARGFPSQGIFPNFRVIYSIQHARVPIVRVVHVPSKTTCDINFSSKFGYYNSTFIGHILGYDTRIKGLAVILKLWSKAYKISERMIMSNYCLVMLMIFYLQNLPQPMLDTIINNQKSKKPIILDPKHKWNVYFNDTINKTRNNEESLRDLLVGFFEFYHKLNFSNYIVSLYNGDLVPRKDFDQHADFAEYRDVVAQSELQPLRFDNPQMFIVQDGFELNLNVGIKCLKHVDFFFEMIKTSFAKCEELKDKPFSHLLTKLFTELEVPKGAEKGPSKAKRKFLMTLHSIAGDLKICQDILSIQDKDKVYSAVDQQEYFFNHVVDGTVRFLKELYLCIVLPVEVTSEAKDPMKREFKVVLHVDTINGRKKMSFKDESTYESEIAISKKMSEKKVRIDLDIAMKISSNDNGKTVEMFMIDNEVQKKSGLLSFGNFFSVNIVPALKFYLKKTCEDITKAAEES